LQVVVNKVEDIKKGFGPFIDDEKLKNKNKALLFSHEGTERVVAAGGELFWYPYSGMSWKEKLKFLYYAHIYIITV